MGMNSIRVLSVEDHGFVSDWLESQLEEAGIEFVGRLESADDLPWHAANRNANLVVIDVNLPGADPFASVEDLRRVRPEVKAAFLSASVSQHHVIAALKAGATGYFGKQDDPEKIIRGLRMVAAGRFAFGESVIEEFPELESLAERLPSALDDFDLDSRSKLGSLTPRELEVLRLLGRGMSRIEIAQTLHRSPKTIDKHRAAVMKKLDIHDRAELVLFAIREGVVGV